MNRSTLASLCAFFLLVAVPMAAQSRDSVGTNRADSPPRGAGSLPAGWTARPDDNSDLKDIKFVTMEPGYHLTLGPATILYRKEDRVGGPFHTLATFHQMKKLKHPEGYGLFIGGRDLDGPGQRYTYFLVREDGKFIIKSRNGATVTEYTKGWQANRAVKKADAKGAATNLLEVDAKIDPKRVSFKVNGQEVYWIPADRIETKGTVGIRANHYLDLHVEGFAVHQ